LKIVFIEVVHNFGGSTKSTLELATRLQKLGHEVVIIDLWGSNQPFLDTVNKLNLRIEIIDKREAPKVLSHNSKLKTVFNKITYLPEFFSYRKKINTLLHKIQPDIVSANNLKCLTLLDYKASYEIDYFARTWFESKSVSKIKKIIYRRFVSRFLTVSQATRQAIASGGLAHFENVEVLHSVIDSSFFYSIAEPSIKDFSTQPINIFHCGGFIETKGQHIAISIASELLKRNVNFKLTLIGLVYLTESSQKYYESILQQIKQLNLEKYVDLIINENDVINHFHAQDVLIHTTSTEGLPRVGLEALALGKPVIANAVGGVTDIVLDNFTGFLPSYNDIYDYSDYIEKYVNNSQLFLKHATQGRSLIEQTYLSENQERLIKKIYPLKDK